MILCNKKMEKLLEKIKKHKFKVYDNKITIKNLMELLEPKFIEIDKCVFFNFKEKENSFKFDIDIVKERYGDLTGFEASCNELKIEHYLEGEPKITLDLLWFSLKVIDNWKYELKKKFPQYIFSIILSYSSETLELKFYKQRKNETLLYEKELDHYKEEAIFISKF